MVDKDAFDEEDFQVARPALERELLSQRQGEALQTWFAQVYETAKIEDNRHYFNYRY